MAICDFLGRYDSETRVVALLVADAMANLSDLVKLQTASMGIRPRKRGRKR